DEHGVATKCTITKHSGYRVLDDAVCKAAMAVNYLPRLVNGKATPGVYRDAFTFRATNEDDGIPQQQQQPF
ncbi:MAG TPA: energy transducer TonB, partial [Candidatus Aquilonibacter sp.]